MPSPTFDIIVGEFNIHMVIRKPPITASSTLLSYLLHHQTKTLGHHQILHHLSIPHQHPTLLHHLSYQFIFIRTIIAGVVRTYHDHIFTSCQYSLFLEIISSIIFRVDSSFLRSHLPREVFPKHLPLIIHLFTLLQAPSLPFMPRLELLIYHYDHSLANISTHFLFLCYILT